MAAESNATKKLEPSARFDLRRLKSTIVHQDKTIFEMRTLLESGKGLSNILKLEPLLKTCMAIVRERYGYRNSVILLRDDLDPDHDLCVIKSHHNIVPDYFMHGKEREPLLMYKLPVDDGLLWQIIRQGKIFSFRDLQNQPRFEVAFDKWNLEVLKSDIWCPLIKSGEVLGIMTLGDPLDGKAAQESDYSFLQEFASIATTNIDSTLKYEKNERILRNIQTLYDVNQQLNNVNDFKRLCKETLAKAIEAVGAQKGNLMLINPETNKLEIRVVWGMIPDHVRDGINNGTTETKVVAIGEGIAGRCAQTRRPIRVNNKEEIPSISAFEVFCMCSVPVLDGDILQGVFTMTNKVTKNASGELVLDHVGRFTEEDMALLQGLADQAGSGLKKAKLYSDSITDRLTDLFNTRHYEESLKLRFAGSLTSGKPLCLAVSDIDHFKKFNDTHGHKAGDAVLKAIAKLFDNTCRTGTEDLAFRYGGEEFCMLMPNTTPDQAARLIEEFRSKVESTPVLYEGKELKVTVSVGIAASVLDTNDEKEIFKFADECLYMCKANGRNQVRVYMAGAKTTIDQVTPANLNYQVYLGKSNVLKGAA